MLLMLESLTHGGPGNLLAVPFKNIYLLQLVLGAPAVFSLGHAQAQAAHARTA